jgi:hypothetical protein
LLGHEQRLLEISGAGIVVASKKTIVKTARARLQQHLLERLCVLAISDCLCRQQQLGSNADKKRLL